MKTIMNGEQVLIREAEAADYLELSIERLQELTDQELLGARYKGTGRGVEIAYDLDDLFAFKNEVEKGGKE